MSFHLSCYVMGLKISKQLGHCDLIYHFLLFSKQHSVAFIECHVKLHKSTSETKDKQSHNKKHVDKCLSSQVTAHWAAFPNASPLTPVNNLPRTCCISPLSFHQTHPGWWHVNKASETNQWMPYFPTSLFLFGDWWHWI